MFRLSSVFRSLLVVAVLSVISGLCLAEEWPLKRKIDLSSGFGDFREGHFHGGIDLRTGGRTGIEVFSPVDGYVYRVSMSYSGYGKGLYIMGDDNYLYVYGHLSQFNDKIDRPVKKAQLASLRYYQDLYFPEDSIRISKGELIAYTGQSGKGAPHLHFEKRTGDNIPLNPLRNGFELSDKIGPTFTRLGIQMVDDHSLFDSGRRKQFIDVVEKRNGHFILDSSLYLHRPFGLLVEGFDQMREGGMQQAIYRLRLYIDNRLMYDTRFDSLSYETTDAVRLEYDYVEAADGRKRVRRLYKLQGNLFSGSRGKIGDGIYGNTGKEKIGFHTVRILGEDSFGNSSELSFDFLWGPPGDIYRKDSLVTLPNSTTEYYFTPVPGFEKLSIDSVVAKRNIPNKWGVPSEVTIEPLENGRILCRIQADRTPAALLRLFVYSGGREIRDNIFNGLWKQQADRANVEWEVIEDGLLVTLNVFNRKASESRIELYYQDTLLGVEYPEYIDISRHVCFLKPKPEYANIDRIGFAMTRDTTHQVREFSDSLNIRIVGDRDNQVIAVDHLMELTFQRDNFYEPRFIEIKRNIPRNKAALHLNSSHYEILPEAFVTRNEFRLKLQVPPRRIIPTPSGICWLDKKKDRWVWLDNEAVGDTLFATSIGGGSFAAVFDYQAPAITKLSVFEGKRYRTGRPRIGFVIVDSLSGIGDDRDISVKIDSKWQIVDYDPETGYCLTQLVEPLAEGRHHLAIIIYDRAGNKTEKYLNFVVAAKKRKQK